MKSAALLASAGAGIALAQSVTTAIPEPAGTSLSPEPITVSGSFDGEGFLYDRDCKSHVPASSKRLLVH